ncbi:restriction endonuclease subunit S [Serratia liquefaciens]|uniref:restriction endonuclease subunit S n=1 Tax=Serratia liquefaciens TaxID=614 RepID=UPI0015A4C801|nr:restriction endonuclease subunit S [Serratia liquefaciens]
MSWPIVKLEQICSRIDYGLTASAISKDDGPRFLRITDIQDDSVDWSSVPSCECSLKELKDNKLENGDIVFARTGATTGKSYLIKKLDNESVFASYLIRIRPNQKVDPLYLSYFFKSSKYWSQITKMANGVAQPGINSTKLKDLEIPLPPLEEQHYVAAILDKVDDIRLKRKYAVKLAGDFLRAKFLDMFGTPANNIHSFPKGKIRDLIDSANYGTSAKASIDSGEYPVLRMGNITYQGGWDFTDLKYLDIKKNEKDKFLVKEGDLLFNRTNSKELVGKTAVYEEDKPMAFAGYLIRVRSNAIGNNYYLSGYLNSIHGKTTLANMCKSIVGMANINAQELQDIEILIPPKHLQDEYERIYKRVKMGLAITGRSAKQLQLLVANLANKYFM